MARRRLIPALPGLLLVMVLVPLDQTALTPALPEIAGDLGGLRLMPQVLTAYLVALTAVLPLAGRLGDRFGRRPVLLAAVSLFVVGALASSLAPTLPVFVGARIVQGLGGGGLMVGAQAAIGELISPRERGSYLGLFGMAYVIPAVLGPLLGGILVDAASWRWIFALHVPLGLLGLTLLARTLRLPRPTGARSVDALGAGSLAALVVALVLLTNTAGTAPPWATAALAAGVVAALGCWVLSTRTAADPVLPPAMLRRRGVALPVALSFTVGFALFGVVAYVPSFARIGLGLSAAAAGLVVTSMMGGAIVTMSLSGRWITRHGRYRRFPVAGTALIATGSLAIGASGGHLSAYGLFALLAVIGSGIGMGMQVMLLAAQNAADPADVGAATASVLFVRQLGATSGVAVVGALVTHAFLAAAPSGVGNPTILTPGDIASLPEAARAAVEAAFATAVPAAILAVTPILAVAFLLALALPALPLRTTQAAEPDLEHP